ncbi:hypothetical protein BDR07DRAFT_1609421 [Suillus spraguei]|nr:hypothetical protein BDR07DRAFT_1609421 [Suillus spraguei]
MDTSSPVSSPTSFPPRSSSPSNCSGSSGRTFVELSTIDFTTHKMMVSPSRSPHFLSPIDEALKAPDGKESLFFRPPSTTPDEALKAPDGKESLLFRPPSATPTTPGTSLHGWHLWEQMLKKHQPYPLCPAPLELRFAACVTGRVHQPEFIPEEIEENEELVERGLSQLSLATLYKAFKAKLASCEAARQCLLTMSWELEEAKCYTSFLEAFHAENRQLLGLEDSKLERMRAWFSSRNSTEVGDDINYLQAVYDDECEILQSLTTQAQQVSKIIGKRSDGIFSASTGESTSESPLDVSLVVDDEDSFDSDND